MNSVSFAHNFWLEIQEWPSKAICACVEENIGFHFALKLLLKTFDPLNNSFINIPQNMLEFLKG